MFVFRENYNVEKLGGGVVTLDGTCYLEVSIIGLLDTEDEDIIVDNCVCTS